MFDVLNYTSHKSALGKQKRALSVLLSLIGSIGKYVMFQVSSNISQMQ